ncbi:hypothetical protein QYR60_05810 [Streptococcus iniae]|nr:hypothetical protein QYR60_05810 [Streptococcus iniae]
MTDKLKATVFIPVYNGENDHLEETLTALYAQKPIFYGILSLQIRNQKTIQLRLLRNLLRNMVT